jgi:peptidoglycan/xylan/chitin deacetylase (PgdA/CDA1 family)
MPRMGRGAIMTAEVLDRVGLPRAALAARRHGLWPKGGLTVVVYHRVADPENLDELDGDLVDATPEEFDAQMGYLKKHFRPVSVEDVLDAHRTRRALPADSVLVTFDDGYRDNHDHALPILMRHGIRALFFIATGHVGARRLFWWERISLLVRKSALASARIEYPEPEELDLTTDASRRRAIGRLNKIVKTRHGLDLERFLGGLAEACGVPWTPEEERARADRALMGWDEVRALRAAGMGIGSHTVWHRVLQTLSAPEVSRELADSRATLEKEMGEPITTIAYPVGRSISAIDGVRDALGQAGYELGFTMVPGVVRPQSDDPFDLHRISVDRDLPTGLARLRLCFPSILG